MLVNVSVQTGPSPSIYIHIKDSIAVFVPGPVQAIYSTSPVILTNVTFNSGISCECSDTTSITIGIGVSIKSGATVTFKAPIVHVNPGFRAENGARV